MLHTLLLLASALLFPKQSLALDRVTVELRQRFPEASLIPWSLAKTNDGALWFATEGGLYRYDGARYARQAAQELPTTETVVAYGDGVAVMGHGRRIAWLKGGGLIWIEPPGIAPLRAIEADDSALWALVGRATMRYDGTWRTIEVPGRVTRLEADAYGVMAIEPKRVWALSSSGSELIADGFSSITHCARTVDSIFVQESQGRTWHLRAGQRSRVDLHLEARNTGLVEHDGVMWATTTNHVARLGPGPPVVTKTPAGPPLFDREGSLWLATFSGPISLPSPDTVVYTVEDGLPTDAVIVATKVGDTIWATTWNGLARFDEQHRKFVAFPAQPALIYTRACQDGEGRTWGITGGGWKQHFIVDLDTGTRIPSDQGFDCTSARGWGWMLHGERIVAIRGETRSDIMLPQNEPQIIASGDDRVWLGYIDGKVCHALAEPAHKLEWTCEQAADDHHITTLWVAPSGHVWVGTRHGGVWRRTARGWTSLGTELPIPNVRSMSASPRGGVWISGSGQALRVEEDGEGWVIRETLRPWYGVRQGTAGAVLDTEQGDLWVASARGLVHIPTTVRDGPVAMALPAWAEHSQGVHGTDPIIRSAGEEHVTLEFTAHALRDPFATRYRFRLGADLPWSEPQAEARLVLGGMAPGDYDISLQAKVSGNDWVSAKTPVRLRVLPPWHATWWFRSALIILTAVVMLVIHRLRVAAALQLQAQRTSIAADLHDEVGSTLSAIRLTASSAAARPMPADHARPMFERIAETSAELGVRLRDIVWCLRPESSNLGALTHFLERRARQLLPQAKFEFEFEVQYHDIVPLSLPVLRNVQLVGLEALHNASKHAQADRVRLSISPEGSRSRWRLVVEDDGNGGVVPSDGLGLSSMKTRAEAIGAILEIEGVAGVGTRVSLIFETKIS